MELYGLCRKRFIVVHKNREDNAYFARNVQLQGIVYVVIIFLEHSQRALRCCLRVRHPQLSACAAMLLACASPLSCLRVLPSCLRERLEAE